MIDWKKIIILIIVLGSCKKMEDDRSNMMGDDRLIQLFEETKGVMEEEYLLGFKSTPIDSHDFYGKYLPRFDEAIDKNPSMGCDIIAYLDSKGIANINPIRYYYLRVSFHLYLNETSLTDEEIFEKIKQVYKRRGINLEGDLGNVVFPDGNVPERWEGDRNLNCK